MRANKRLITAAVTAAALAGLLTACGKQEATKGAETPPAAVTETQAAGGIYQKLSVAEAKARMDSGDDIIILDVRTQEEYEEKHIPGAIVIPNEEIGKEPLSQLPDLDKEILVYCRSGNRSAQAAKKLVEAGYTNVYDFGGIKDWTYDTESGAAPSVENAESKAAAENAESTENVTAENGVLGKFKSVTLDGEEVDQEIFTKADLTMVNIWGTFCGPCIGEMPDLGELNRAYKDKGFQIVGIISDVVEANDPGAVEIVNKTEADYTHMVLSEDLYNNYLALVTVVPTTIFVDKEGKQVGSTYAGSKSKSKWKSIIDANLEKVQK